MLAHIALGDTAALATLITLTFGSVGALILGYLKLTHLHKDVNDVQNALRLPSNPDKSIAAEFEGMSQSLHFLAKLFEEQSRDRRSTDWKEQ